MYYSEYASSCLEFDVRIPTMLVSGFRKKGMVQQADILMNKTLRNIRSSNKPITPLLQELGKLGTQVKPSEWRDLIKNLRDSNKFSIALEASSWLCDQEVINLFPEDYVDRLDLTEKVLGLKEADEFFDTSIPETMKGYSVYTTLLNMYTISYQNVRKAEANFEKMGELGLSSFYAFYVLRLQGLLTVSLSFPDADHGSVLLVLSPVASRFSGLISRKRGFGSLSVSYRIVGGWMLSGVLFIALENHFDLSNGILDSTGRLQKKMAVMPFELKGEQKFHEIYCFAFGWAKEKLKQSLI
ncbi:hypothetical protein Bca52824_018630 [Brassica carinata]|uniref:Pentatricopeptide repeat-containing protein n=1 Tax=Brassica carinata TaxID=52824 RepID=A0A8X7VQW9_BRACI|nr:hypothetical protein Bca52824_018630 [Brassica carinata]